MLLESIWISERTWLPEDETSLIVQAWRISLKDGGSVLEVNFSRGRSAVGPSVSLRAASLRSRERRGYGVSLGAGGRVQCSLGVA